MKSMGNTTRYHGQRRIHLLEVSPPAAAARYVAAARAADWSVACGCPGFFPCWETTFRQQKTPEGPQIVKNAPACRDVEIEFGEIERNQQEGFFATIRTFAFRYSEFGFHVAPGLIKGFREHCYILMRPLDIVKWRFGLIAHRHAFPTIQPAWVALPLIKCSSFSHKTGALWSRQW